MKLTRAFTFMEKFGRLKGLQLYLQLKWGSVDRMQVPGISKAFTLRKGSSDIAVFDQVFLQNEYEIDLPFKPRVIIDAGANIGLFSIVMKNKFQDANIICIEPDPANFELLKKNLSGYTNIELVNSGLWNEELQLDLVSSTDNNFSAVSVVPSASGSGIKSVTIDQIRQRYSIDRIDLLKIDIETAEEALFSGNYESWLPHVKMIVIELHDWMKEGCSRPFFNAINQCFKKYTYSVVGENTVILNCDLI